MDRFFLSLIFLLNLGYNQAQELKTFSNEGKFGFMQDQNIVIPATFDYACDFSQGLALVKTNGKWGFIDESGKWRIQPEFDKAQSFQDSLSYVEKSGKVGLLNLDGSFRIKTEYTNIVEDYNGYFLMGEKGMKGYRSKKKGEEIPANYKDFVIIYDLVSAQNADETWDIYFKGKLQVEDCDQKIDYAQYDYTTECIVIKFMGLYGVFELGKTWLIEANYAKIDLLNFSYYQMDYFPDKSVDFIYALHSSDISNYGTDFWDYTGDYVPDSILLAKADGRLISTKKFEYIAKRYEPLGDNWSPEIIQLSVDARLYNLYSDFRLEKLNYSQITPHMNNMWYIANGENYQYILNYNMMVLDSFPSVRKYMDYNYSWNEYGEDQNFDMQEINEPFLIVSKNLNGEQSDKAIYSLEEERVISPWMTSTNELTVYRSQFANSVFYSYGFGENSGFYTRGMEKGTELNYYTANLFSSIGNNFIAIRKNAERPEGQQAVNELYQLKEGKVSKVLEPYNIFPSGEIVTYEYNYSDETGESDPVRVESFTTPFFILKDEQNKYGLVLPDGQVFLPQFDSLIPNNSGYGLVSTLKAGKYGNINLFTGQEIKPAYDYELSFMATNQYREIPFYYAFVQADNEFYYIDIKGKRFASLSESVNIKKVKKRYGLSGYTFYDGQGVEEVMQVEAGYKLLENTFKPDLYKARGMNKKWGYIDFIGDTIVPLKFDKIINPGEEFNFGYYYVLTQIKNLLGVAELNSGEIIPCEYDKISQFIAGDYASNAFLVEKNTKFGLYSALGEVIFPCIYDKIEVIWTENDFEYLLIVASLNGKKQVRRYNNANLKPVTDPENLISYDFILNSLGYIKQGNFVDVYDLRTNKKVDRKSNDRLNISGVLYDIKFQDGKFGAVDKSGNELIPCIYESTEFFEGRDEVMVGFENGVKYYIYVFDKKRFTEHEW